MNPEITSKLTAHAKKSLKEAQSIALQAGSPEINPEHLFLAIYFEKGSLGNNILEGMKLDRKKIDELIFRRAPRENSAASPAFSAELKKIITRAYHMAAKSNFPYVGTEHLLYALLDSPSALIQKMLPADSLGRKTRAKEIRANLETDPLAALSKIFDLPELALTKNRKNQLKTTPFLDQFCVDLNLDSARRDDITVGRERELARLITILGRKLKNNPILIGDPGVGKTAIVSGLAQKINRGEVPHHLAGKRILALDLALVVAGTSFRGEFEARLKEIIKEATLNKSVILFIDEIHTIVGAGNVNGGLDAANILKPALSRGDLQCIGATTFSEFKKHFERDAALERRFQPVIVPEPSIPEALSILKGLRRQYESFHNVSISEEALEQAVELSARYITERFLPDKAIDVIDETASALRSRGKNYDLLKKIRKFEQDRELAVQEKNRLINEEKYDEAVFFRDQEKKMSEQIEALKTEQGLKERLSPIKIGAEDVARTVSQTTGIPLERISIRRNIDFPRLKKNLENKIVGQSDAIKTISQTLLRSYSGIANPDRPLGSFLFLGPTGVGKTLTAKMLAEEIFGTPDALIRIDMSEFMEKHNVSRLLGAPAGYIGYEEGGKLTEKIRHQPFSVILFDEIEKAHPDVFNILLQILEDGALTDAEGRKVNFKNTIILLTSNIGTRDFTNSARLGFKTIGSKTKLPQKEELQNKVLDELKREVKPEILNRLDHIIVFSPLSAREIEKIARLELDKLKKRLREQGLEISFSPGLVRHIAQRSFAFEQGARLVRKNIQDLVENEIAASIISCKISNNRIRLGVSSGKITSN